MIAIDHDPWVLGIDCSAYTTSVAVVRTSGQWHQARRVLEVPQGARGLRPSDALFAHVQNLPGLVEDVMAPLDDRNLAWVAVSVAPRPTPDSYLPPFLAGEAVARSVAACKRVPLLRTTHQEGHIRAGLAGSGLPGETPFFAFHLSGGTTELLRVVPQGPRLAIEILGGSDDLYVGQFVDRVGVLLGLSFPAGPSLDGMIVSAPAAYALPWSRPRLKEGRWWTSFSGPESAAERAISEGIDGSRVARGMMESIAQSLVALLKRVASTGDLLVIGGVAANTFLRQRLGELLPGPEWRVWFAEPDWSRDNAIGVAYLGLDAWRASTASAISG